MLVWQPRERLLSRATLPLWMSKVATEPLPLEALAGVGNEGLGALMRAKRRGDELNIRIGDLERYGRTLLLDGVTADGKHVMMWNQLAVALPAHTRVHTRERRLLRVKMNRIPGWPARSVVRDTDHAMSSTAAGVSAARVCAGRTCVDPPCREPARYWIVMATVGEQTGTIPPLLPALRLLPADASVPPPQPKLVRLL